MMRDSWVRFRWWCLLLCAGLLASLSGIAMGALSGHAPISPAIPQGQGKIMQFQSGGHILGFGSDRVYMVGLGYALIEEFVGASQVTPVAGSSAKPVLSGDVGKGDEPAPPFQGVTYPELWKGITLRYDRASGGLAESVYVVQPGADVNDIRVRYNTDFRIGDNGGLRFQHPTKRGYYTLSRPVAWQEIDGKRVPVEVSFRDCRDRTLGFSAGARDPAYALVIDPIYQWHTFYGYAGVDEGRGIAVTENAVYVAGYSKGTWNGDDNEPPLHGYSGGENEDIVVIKLDRDGAYQWHTFYGNTSYDSGLAIAATTDAVYVTGMSRSTWNGDGNAPPRHGHSGLYDIVVLKLNSLGAYQWHTFYGSGPSYDYGYGIAVTSDAVYVTGTSESTWDGDGPTGPLHPYSGGDKGLVVLKLDTAGAYQWHTFYGIMYTTGEDTLGIAVTGDAVYVTGISNDDWNGDGDTPPLRPYSGGGDIVVLKLDTAGAYQWHTFYGSGCADFGLGIAVTGDAVYVTGAGNCSWNGGDGDTVPLHPHSEGYDICVLKLATSGAYQWHTFYGSTTTKQDKGHGIAVTGDAVFVTGESYGWNGDGDTTPLHSYSGGYDICVLKLATSGAYQWHTFYGNAGSTYPDDSYGVAVTDNVVYVTGTSVAGWNGDDDTPPLHAHIYHDIVVLKLFQFPPYTVTYDGNGADSGTEPDAQEKIHGVGLTLAENTGNLGKTGHTFAGWNTQADGLGTDYAAGGTYTANEAVTLYAKWTANNYTVTFDATGGIAPDPGTKEVTYGEAYGTLATTTRAGYTFNGWFTEATGGTEVTSGTTVTTAVDHTLYAQWTAEDTTPDPFSFIDQTGTPLSTLIISNPVAVTGINSASPISITGGDYRIDGGSWTDAGGTVSLDDVVEVRVTSSAANETTTSATLTIGGVSDTFSVTTAGADDPNATGLVAWWKAEDNAYDSVGGNHGTLHGGVSYADAREGRGFTMDGVDGSRVSVPDDSDLTISGDVTVAAWVKRNAAGESFLVMKGAGSIGGLDAPTSYVLQFAGNDTLLAGFEGDGGSNEFFDGPVVADTEFHHVAYVREGSGHRLYLDGEEVNAETFAGTPGDTTGIELTLGALLNEGSYGYAFEGILDEVKIFKRALSVGEVNMLGGTRPDAFSFIDQTGTPLSTLIISNPVAVTGINSASPISITGGDYRIDGGSWTDAGGTVSLDDVVEVRVTSSAANETTTSATLTIGGVSDTFSVTTAAAEDPNATGLVAWWKAEDNAYDSIGGNHGTAQGGLIYAAGQAGQAYSFNGTDAYVDIAITPSLDFGTDNFTISFWMDLNALTQQTLVHKSVGDVPANTNKTYFVEYDFDTSALRFRTSDLSVTNDLLAPFTFTTGEWYHVTAVRSGVTNILYVNGVAIDSQTAGGLADTGSGGYFRIGQIAPNGLAGVERYVNGKLDEIKLYSRALSVGEVNMLGGTKPDAFSFIDQTDAALGSLATSNSITVSGINSPSPISIVGGTYSINGGAYTADPGTVNNGDTVTVQQTASGSYSTMTTATLTIGGVGGAFNVTTIAEPAKITVTFDPNGGTAPNPATKQVTYDATYGDLATTTRDRHTFNGWFTAPTGGTEVTSGATVTTAANHTLYAQWTAIPTRYVCSDGICGDNTPCHRTLREAVDAATTGTLILIAAEEQDGNFILNTDKDLTLQGGWDTSFENQNGTTTLHGAPKAPQGRLIFQMLSIKP